MGKLCFIALPLLLSAAEAAQSGEEILAEVDGTPVTLREFELKHPTILFSARNNFYEAQRRALEQFLDQWLLERQAQKENLTVDQLLHREVEKKLPKDPSEESLRVYYEGLDTNEPFEAVKDKIIDALRQRRRAKARSAYVEALRKQANIVIRLEPPRAPISLAETPTRGAANPLVTLVEYADYECPFCLQIRPAVARLEQEYKGHIAYAYKDVPLPMHPNAQKAAEAAHCAGAQGRFWDYHDQIFARKKADPDTLKAIAADLRLDVAAFQKCLDSGQTAPLIQRSVSEAQALGIQGTPTFFVNGRYLSSSASYEKLRELIEAELKSRRQDGLVQVGKTTPSEAR